MATTTTIRRPLSVDDILAGFENPDWLGWGYLGERLLTERAVDSGEIPAENGNRIFRADRAAVVRANELGWSPEQFFDWLNSKDGRWYADSAINSYDDFAVAARTYVR